MKKFINLCAIIICLSFAAPTFAADMTLVEAKNAGLIGERDNGLVGAVLPNPSSEITDLVNTTNSGRMAVYKETAAKQNIPLNQVREIAAQKIFNMTTDGQYIFLNGKWTQK